MDIDFEIISCSFGSSASSGYFLNWRLSFFAIGRSYCSIYSGRVTLGTKYSFLNLFIMNGIFLGIDSFEFSRSPCQQRTHFEIPLGIIM